jgi:PAS domain S-box-containing protein
METGPSRLSWSIVSLDSPFHTLVLACFVAMLSYLSTALGLTMIVPPQNISPLWPTNAVLLVVLLAVPRRVWPILIATACVVVALLDLRSGDSIAVTFWLVLANATEVLIAALAISYFFKNVPRFNSAKALAQYSLFAVILPPFVGAFVGAFAGTRGSYWLHWRLWFLSDSLALLTLPPAVWGLVRLGSRWRHKSRAYYLELAALIATLGLLGYINFVASVRSGPPALVYSLVPFLLWSAFRFGSIGVSSSVIVVTVLSIWGAVHGRGPFTEQGPLNNVLSLQLFLLFAAAPFMVLAALVEERKEAEVQLREGEDKLRLLLESTAEAIYGIDLEGRCTFCNPACLRALGYERVDELFGKKMHHLIHHTLADGTLFPEEECRIIRAFRTGEGVHVSDEVLWRANGTSFAAEYWSFPQRKGQEVVGAVVAFFDITERKLAEDALRDMSGRLITAHEEERMHLARELYDDLSQRMALLSISLQRFERGMLDLSSKARQELHNIAEVVKEVSSDIHNLSHQLHPSRLDHVGLVAAVEGSCRELSKQYELQIKFVHCDVSGQIPKDVTLCLFRIVQEALRNVVKHSGAAEATVELTGHGDRIDLCISDSGAGFSAESMRGDTGLGLISMRERLRLVGGRLVVESEPSHGTRIQVHIPLRSTNEQITIERKAHQAGA